MNYKIKKIIALIMIVLTIMPQLTYANSDMQKKANVSESTHKVLKKITVTPKNLEVPKGTDEDKFRELITVQAYYNGEKEPVTVTDYRTNYSAIKDKIGRHNVYIAYTEKGCTQKIKICVGITGEEIKEPTEPPTVPPTEPITNLPYVGGYEDKTFRTDQDVTREELASMIARLIAKNEVPKVQNTYPDLNPTRYSTDNINYVTKLGIFKPYEDGTFRPTEKVSTKEFLEIAGKLAPYIKGEAAELNKLAKTNKNITRAEAVVILNQLFKRICTNEDIPNPYTDLTPSYWAYKPILCASVKNTQPVVQPR